MKHHPKKLNPHRRPAKQEKAVIVFSGGPAPGAGRFAEAVHAELNRRGIRTFACRHGFGGILDGGIGALHELSGHSLHSESFYHPPVISFGRDGPGQDLQAALKLVDTLLENGFKYLIGFGGEGTANTVLTLYRAAKQRKAQGKGELRVGMGPKSMDWDLPCDTIGYATVAEFLALLVENSTRDAQLSDNRWMLLGVQGRLSGAVAYKAATDANASMFIIPEQFDSKINFSHLINIMLGGMLKALVGPPNRRYRAPLYRNGRLHGSIVIAEGVALKIKESTFPALRQMKKDRQGRPDLSDFDFPTYLQDAINSSLGELGVVDRLNGPFMVKGERLGTTARGAKPNMIDRDLALTLGTAIVSQMVDEGFSGIVPFKDVAPSANDRVGHHNLETFVDAKTGLIPPRLVNTKGDTYRTKWHAFRGSRLLPSDLKDPKMLKRLTYITGLSKEAFIERFRPAAEWGA